MSWSVWPTVGRPSVKKSSVLLEPRSTNWASPRFQCVIDIGSSLGDDVVHEFLGAGYVVGICGDDIGREVFYGIAEGEDIETVLRSQCSERESERGAGLVYFFALHGTASVHDQYDTAGQCRLIADRQGGRCDDEEVAALPHSATDAGYLWQSGIVGKQCHRDSLAGFGRRDVQGQFGIFIFNGGFVAFPCDHKVGWTVASHLHGMGW